MYIFAFLAARAHSAAPVLFPDGVDAAALEIAEGLGADPDPLAEVIAGQVEATLQRRADHGVPTVASDLDGIVGYEAFKLDAYVRSGVFPKRYTGYLDRRHDTADAEWDVVEAVICAVAAANRHLTADGSTLRIDEADVAVTFLAEGGTLMLNRPDSPRDGLHPVMDVGLDDIAKGSADLGGLLEAIDRDCDTALGQVTVETPIDDPPPQGAIARLFSRDGQNAWLMRGIDLREAIVGTTVMWVWELDIAHRKLIETGRPAFMDLDRHDRFIVGSLVYNSGILHSRSTLMLLRGFRTGDYLYERSEANAARRPRLDLDRPPVLLAEVLSGQGYRTQWTSWVAVYHVLQRYGAWVALHRFDRVFDDAGRFVDRERPAPPPPPPPVDPVPSEPVLGGGMALVLGVGLGSGAVGLAAALALRARRRRAPSE